MGNSVEKRKITPPQDIWKFPFTLQIAFIHRFDEKEDKIDGDYEGSKVYISLLGKSYRENVLFIVSQYSLSNSPNFAFSIPLTEKEFNEINQEIKIEVIFYKENDFYFGCDNFLLPKLSTEDIGYVNSANDIALKLEKDEKKSFPKNCNKFSFDIEYRISGSDILKYLEIENCDNTTFRSFFSSSKISNTILFDNQRKIYTNKAIDIIFNNLIDIKNSHDEEKKIKYTGNNIDETIDMLVGYSMENKIEIMSPSKLDIILSDFYSNSFQIFKQRRLYNLIENNLYEHLKNNMRGIILAISAGFINHNYNCQSIFEAIRKDNYLLNIFVDSIDKELILKSLSLSGKFKSVSLDLNLQNNTFFYMYLSKIARRKMYDNLNDILNILEKDQFLNSFQKAFDYALRAEFENNDIIWSLLTGSIKEFDISEQHSIFVSIIKLNDIIKSLYFKIEEDDYIGKLLDKQVIKLKIFEKFYSMINDDSSNYLTVYLIDIIENMFKRPSGYGYILEETSNLSNEELKLFLNRKFFKFLISENFERTFAYVWKNINISNLSYLLDNVFDTLIELYILKSNDYSNDNLEFSSILKYIESNSVYSKKLIDVMTKEFLSEIICNVTKKFNPKLCNIIFKFEEIRELFNSCSKNLRDLYGNSEFYPMLEEVIYKHSYKIENLNLNIFKVDNLVENEDINSITKLKVTRFESSSNISIILKDNINRPFYITHIWLSQAEYIDSNVKSAIFISGTGELPSENEIKKFHNFNFEESNEFDFERFNYLGGFNYDQNYKFDRENLMKIVKINKIQRSDYVLIILLSMFGDQENYFFIGGLGCFGSFVQEDAELIASNNYNYLEIKDLI